MKEKTVTINGTVYDSRTGMPLRTDRSQTTVVRHDAHSVHVQTQKSKTLNRRYVKRDSTKRTPARTLDPITNSPTAIIVRHKRTIPVEHPAHQTITKFAPAAAPEPVTVKSTPDIAPTRHAIAVRAEHKVQSQKQPERVIKPSDVIKREAIEQAMAKTAPKTHKKEVKVRKERSKFNRFAGMASASLAILVLGAYFTYLNMPALSTRVAASQAGIDANYPGYQPSGYSLNGPVTYQQGSVSMKFAANAGPQNYTLSQANSDWDSTAVLEQYVAPQAGSKYTATNTSGLTIYTYDNKAVWVNGGILYTIDGNSLLSNDQIQRIATSL